MKIGINQARLPNPERSTTRLIDYGHDFVKYDDNPRRLDFKPDLEFSQQFDEVVNLTFRHTKESGFSILGIWAFEASTASDKTHYLEGVKRVGDDYNVSQEMLESCTKIMITAAKNNILVKWTLIAPDKNQQNIGKLIKEERYHRRFYRNCVKPFLNSITKDVSIEGNTISLSRYIYYLDLINEANFCHSTEYNIATESEVKKWITNMVDWIYSNYKDKIKLSVSIAFSTTRPNDKKWMSFLYALKPKISYLDIHVYNDNGEVPSGLDLLEPEKIRDNDEGEEKEVKKTPCIPVILSEFGLNNNGGANTQTRGMIDDNFHATIVKRFLDNALERGYEAAMGWRLIVDHSQTFDYNHGHAYFGFFQTAKDFISQSEADFRKKKNTTMPLKSGEWDYLRFSYTPRKVVDNLKNWIPKYANNQKP